MTVQVSSVAPYPLTPNRTAPPQPPHPPRRERPPAPSARLYERLSEKSVAKHFDAYRDIDWDAADHRLDPRDPRFELGNDDPLGKTDWYRSLPADTRARLGLHKIAAQMRLGLEFENVLARGLLEFAMSLPSGAPEFRYAYHEIIEEGQHTLMFNEFIRRAGLDTRGLPAFERIASRRVVRYGRTFPEMFMLFVLGGEAPIDRIQRSTLASDRDLHPLLERVMRIHVLEEARHLCFAKHYLTNRAPELGPLRRFQLSVRGPILLRVMAGGMMRVPGWLAAKYGADRHVLDAAYDTEDYRSAVRDGIEPVRQLMVDLGLVTPLSRRIWSGVGLWPRATDGA